MFCRGYVHCFHIFEYMESILLSISISFITYMLMCLFWMCTLTSDLLSSMFKSLDMWFLLYLAQTSSCVSIMLTILLPYFMFLEMHLLIFSQKISKGTFFSIFSKRISRTTLILDSLPSNF